MANMEIIQPVQTIEVHPIQDFLRGPRGYSAYELACQNGFEGTLEEYLESLKGKQEIQAALQEAKTYTDEKIENIEIITSEEIREIFKE